MKKFYIFAILLVFAVPASGATVYKWVDEKGVVNFTDEFNNVPSSYRDRVEMKHYITETVTPDLTKGLAPAYTDASPEKGAEAKVDLYGRDYWKKQLDEATWNYEKVREELLKEGKRLVWYRYGGKTQYQMFTAELPGISERLEAYREQVIEAKDMLETFKDETQETGVASGKRALSPQTDIYGRDETWWKEEVRPWKEELKKANQGYEEASEAAVKQLEGLGPFRWGGLSLTQYQMISSSLTGLYDRMAHYQTQISEAKGTLAKLSKEAKETKADPAWLE